MAFLIRISGPRIQDAVPPIPRNTASLEEIKMDELIRQIFAEENITQDVWNTSRNGKFFIVEFPVIGRDFSERILDRLAYYNVGKTDDSTIMVIEPAAMVYKKMKGIEASDIPMKHFQKFVNSLKSRLTVAQVYHAISSQGNFNFNYLSFLICAAIVADIALVTDSAACVFASMLLSPIMEPIMCIIFGLSLHEKRMIKKGFRNTSVSLLLCIFVGLTFGIAAHYISMFEETKPYPTSEMVSRGTANSLIGAVIVASASGVSISFAILSNSLAAMIGNAISLSLLPPAVNSGQLFLLAVIALIDKPYVMTTTQSLKENTTIMLTVVECDYWWIKDYNFIYVDNSCDTPKEFAILATVSFCLTLLNIIIIIITGYSVNRLKDLVPKSFTNEETRTFYTKDLKEVRDNYDCVHRLGAADLANQAYQEYIRLSNVLPENGDQKALSPEHSQQLSEDFRAVMEGIGKDRHVQTISSWTSKGKDPFLAHFVKATDDLVDRRDRQFNGKAVTIQNPPARRSYISETAGKLYNNNQHLPEIFRRQSFIDPCHDSLENATRRNLSSCQVTLYGSAAAARLEKLKELAGRANDSFQIQDGDDDDDLNGSSAPVILDDLTKHKHTSLDMLHQSLWNAARHKPRASEELDIIPTRENKLAKANPYPLPSLVLTKSHDQAASLAPYMNVNRAEDSNLQFGMMGETPFRRLPLSRVSSVDSFRMIEDTPFVVHEKKVSTVSADRQAAEHNKPTLLSTNIPFNNKVFTSDSISKSVSNIIPEFYQNRKAASTCSVSTIGGKFEVTPTLWMMDKPENTAPRLN